MLRWGGIVLAVLALIVGGRVAYGVYAMWKLGLFEPHPSDEALVATFEQHREDFDALVAMIREDNAIGIARQGLVYPEGAISAQRKTEYERVFARIGFDDWAVYRGRDTVRITAHTKFFPVSSDKGFVFNPEDPEPVYESLDEIPDDLEPMDEAYRRIDEDWFLTLRYLD